MRHQRRFEMAGKLQIVVGIIREAIFILAFLDSANSHIDFFSG
jgi:hypothetical protein